MRYKLLLLLMMYCVFVKAQITVTSADMANVNDTVRFSTSATDVSAMLNDTGANRTWNFSNLVPNFQDVVSFKNALSANILYSSFSSSSYGTQDPDISFTLASATNVYSFYTKSTASYVADGRAFTVSGLPGLQTYTGKDVIYKFPLAYGNRDTNSYTTNSVSLLVANLTSSGKRTNVVDGWGTLTTPYGTYNCIRIKSIVQETDTVQITTPVNFSLPVAHNKTEYKWFTNGKKIPILEVDVTTGTGAATTIKYRDSVRANAFNGLANFKANKTVFAANPSDVCTLINTSLNSPKSCAWTITPNTYTITSGSLTYDTLKINFTAPGNYTIKLHAVYNAGISDTTRVNYIYVGAGPSANFGSSVVGNTSPVTIVSLYDSSKSSNTITAWKWTFAPNKVSFVGGTTSTSQNPKITFDSATNYAVTLRVTDSVGSNSITKNFGVFNTGINVVKQNHQSIIIYPNPAENYFEMSVNQNEIDHFELYDIAGKLFQPNSKWNNQNSCRFDCSQLSRGIYFVKIYYNDKQTDVKKISIR
jgi:hypothetical protein